MKLEIASLHYQKFPMWLVPFLPLEWGYWVAVRSRLRAYRTGKLKRHSVDVPVISVGNLTTGGTGKTPVVLALAEALQASGKKVVILSRGYGATEPLDYGRASHPRHGDEAFLLQQALPEVIVIVGRDRVHTAQRAIAEHRPDVIVLDDGFQYIRLARNWNILLVDGELAFGNGHLLPLGPLREPWTELRRADEVWITKNLRPETLPMLEERVARVSGAGTPPRLRLVPFEGVGFQPWRNDDLLDQKAFHGREAIAFCGIARPERFETDLAHLGVTLRNHLRFPDHHTYTVNDVARLHAAWREAPKGTLVLTTDKDKVKLLDRLPEEMAPSVYTLRVRPRLDPEWIPEALFQ